MSKHTDKQIDDREHTAIETVAVHSTRCILSGFACATLEIVEGVLTSQAITAEGAVFGTELAFLAVAAACESYGLCKFPGRTNSAEKH